MKIGHFFVGSCVESELLNEYGKVYGFGIEPTFYSQENVEAFIQCDLRRSLPTNLEFDFGLFHPPCKRWATCKNTNYENYDNLIPRAKEIAKEKCRYWVIENVRNSPIGYDPDLRLNGSMFNLPIKYERCFWTNYKIKQPKFDTDYNYKYSVQNMKKAEGYEAKKYNKRYYAHDIIRNCLPKPYVKHIITNCPIF